MILDSATGHATIDIGHSLNPDILAIKIALEAALAESNPSDATTRSDMFQKGERERQCKAADALFGLAVSFYLPPEGVQTLIGDKAVWKALDGVLAEELLAPAGVTVVFKDGNQTSVIVAAVLTPLLLQGFHGEAFAIFSACEHRLAFQVVKQLPPAALDAVQHVPGNPLQPVKDRITRRERHHRGKVSHAMTHTRLKDTFVGPATLGQQRYAFVEQLEQEGWQIVDLGAGLVLTRTEDATELPPAPLPLTLVAEFIESLGAHPTEVHPYLTVIGSVLNLLRQDLPPDATVHPDPAVVAALVRIARASAAMLQDALDRGDPIEAEAALQSLADLADLGGSAVLRVMGTLLRQVMPKVRAHEAASPMNAGTGDRVLIALIDLANKAHRPKLQRVIINVATRTGRVQVLFPAVFPEWNDVLPVVNKKAEKFKSAQQAMVLIANLTQCANSMDEAMPDKAESLRTSLLFVLPEILLPVLAIEPKTSDEKEDHKNLALYIWLCRSIDTGTLWHKNLKLASYWLDRLRDRKEFEVPMQKLMTALSTHQESYELPKDDSVLSEILKDNLDSLDGKTLAYLLFSDCGPEGLKLYPENRLDFEDWPALLLNTRLGTLTVELLERRARNGTLVVNAGLARLLFSLSWRPDSLLTLTEGMAEATRHDPDFFAALLATLPGTWLRQFGLHRNNFLEEVLPDRLRSLIDQMAASLPLGLAQKVVSPFLKQYMQDFQFDAMNWLGRLLLPYVDIGTAADLFCRAAATAYGFDAIALGQHLRLNSVGELKLLIDQVRRRGHDNLVLPMLQGWLETHSLQVADGPQDQESQLVQAVRKEIKRAKK